MSGKTLIVVLVGLAAVAIVAAVIASGDSGDGGDGAATDDFQFEQADAADADHWAGVWCQIDGSMTRDDVIELMGEPSGEFDATSGAQPQSEWDVGAFGYTVFYESTGHVDQAYVNPLELDKQDAPFDCALVRMF